MSGVIPFQAEKATLVINAAVNAALEHVAGALGVSKSNYVEALLRVKFGMPADDLLCRWLTKEGIATPEELSGFSPDAPPKRDSKPGPKPRTSSRIAVGEIAHNNLGRNASINIGAHGSENTKHNHKKT